jgi:hypothetical protein
LLGFSDYLQPSPARRAPSFDSAQERAPRDDADIAGRHRSGAQRHVTALRPIAQPGTISTGAACVISRCGTQRLPLTLGLSYVAELPFCPERSAVGRPPALIRACAMISQHIKIVAGTWMPEIKRFGGYRLLMFFKDENPPHVHVAGPGFAAKIRIANGDLLAGDAPGRVLRQARSWIEDHRSELLATWDELQG